MATNTKTRRAKPAASDIADVLTSVQCKVDAEVEAINADIALIDSRLPVARARVQDAVDGTGEVADIEARWRKGEDVPDLAHTLATEKDKAARVVVESLPNQRAALTKGLPARNTIPAEHIKPLLQALLPGVPVFATNAPSRMWQDDVPDDAVGVVLVQEPDHDVDASTGALSGKVRVHYYRLPVYAAINVEALERAAKAARISLEVTSNAPAGAGGSQLTTHDPSASVCDRLTIKVSNVFDGLPSIERVDTSGLHSRDWVTSALRQNGSHPSPVPVDQERFAFQWKVEVGPHTWVIGQPAEVRSQDATAAGRKVVVTQKMNTHNVDPSDFVATLRTVLAEAVGTVSRGLGLLEGAEVNRLSESRTDRSANYELVLTYASKATDAEQVEQRARNAAEAEAAEQVRESREVAAEERREAAKRRLHPGEQVATA